MGKKLNKKYIFGVALILVILVIILVIALNNSDKSTTNDVVTETSKTIVITINVFDKENNEIYADSVNTDDTYLADVLEEIDTLEVEMEDSEYGKYITSIMGIEQGDNYYWSYYINDEYAEVGVSSCELEENAVYSFKIEKYEY